MFLSSLKIMKKSSITEYNDLYYIFMKSITPS